VSYYGGAPAPNRHDGTVITPHQLVDILLYPVFGFVLATWAGASLYLLVTGLRSGRRALALAQAGRDLAAITAPDADDDGLRTAVVSLVSRLPDEVVLPLASRATTRPRLDRIVAEAAIARIGRGELDALVLTRTTPKHNWRRIAAMRVLAAGAPPARLVELLGHALQEYDPEIVGAALAVLGGLHDPGAAVALVESLKQARYSQSRIATYIDQFPLPVAGLLQPLLHHPDANVRYWGATLVSRHAQPEAGKDLAALTTDPSPFVRKAAIVSLAQIDASLAAPAAAALLADPVWYVRAHAARALADSRGVEAAEEIAPLLADSEWWVRLAARESLQRIGDEIWSVLVPYLDHPDAFARNGAAEVLQNIGVLDSLIVLEAATSRPSASKVEMLRKIVTAGGTRMTTALLERVQPEAKVRVRNLLDSLGLSRSEAQS
jgi:HEAT repeat protein